MQKLESLGRAWDLDAFFPGGPESPQYAAFLDALEADVAEFKAEIAAPAADAAAWAARLSTVQSLMSRSQHAGAFINCHGAADVSSLAARALGGRTRQINAQMETVDLTLSTHMLAMGGSDFETLLGDPAIAPLAFNLRERRDQAQGLLPPDQEAVVSALSVNGYHGWADFYTRVVGGMSVEIEENGKTLTLSMGQLQNRLSDPDPAKRAYYMDVWDAAWDSMAETIAMELNQLGGFRLSLYKLRGWDDFMHEPLMLNRMKAETLDSMHQAIAQNLPRMLSFVRRKKALMGLDTFGWQDIDAPLSQAGGKLTYDEAANFVVENFAKLSPKMADLAVRAFEHNWIESEDRPGKRMGGFCSGFPEAKESRIFVTFSGSMGNLATLAHELGHAYHGEVLKGLPPMARRYAMNVAETASTFAEVLVGDASIEAAGSKEERLALIEGKLGRAVTQMTNLVCRFIFEKSFYEERQKGEVPVARLNELMLAAQKEAYGDVLDRWHPTFWASKLHFHMSRPPFYNFPYTFGYLFATGIFAQAKKAGPAFDEKYSALLMDTGRSTVEDLAMKHLGLDVSKPEFWLDAIDLAYAELDEWLEETK